MTGDKFAQSVAVIGAGCWGKNIVRNFYELNALHTICDINESLLQRYVARYPSIKTTNSVAGVLNNPLITQVAIATPSSTHYELAKQALLAGKDVYVEKPFCLDTAEAEELVKLAEELGRILMVGHILQYHPSIVKLQEMIEAGVLGQIQYIASNRLNLGKIKTKENVLWDLATHDISIILSLCGYHLPLLVRCMGSEFISEAGADIALMTMEFPENIRTHIFVSWLNPIKEHKLTITGSRAMVIFDDTKPWKEKLTIFKDPIIWTDKNVPLENPQDGEHIGEGQGNPLKEECRHFMRCSVNRTTPKTSGREGLTVMKVLAAAQESLSENGTTKEPSLIQHSLLVGT